MALVLAGQTGDSEQVPEPIADQNFGRKKMFDLQQEVSKLQKLSLKQHQATATLETGLKSMISETDLRRALGLAFQEFENRIEDAFQDSNRKCLAMFSKREEVVDLQATITKKVNWAEYNAVLKKLSDLRQYVDGMAESVFIGQREALESEFAKKASTDWVEKALTEKAGFSELIDVRARLERLEVLVTHNDQKHSNKLQAMQQEAASQNEDLFQRHSVLMKEANTTMASSKQQFQDMKTTMERHEARLKGVDSSMTELGKAQQELTQLAQRSLVPRLEAAEQCLKSRECVESARQELLSQLERKSMELKTSVEQQLEVLAKQSDNFKDQLEFLMEATDMLKRRLREISKSQDGKWKELTEDQGRQVQQLAALERVMKKQEREVRAIERAKEPDWRTLPVLAPEEEANMRLSGVLDQLEKISRSQDSTQLTPWHPRQQSADTTGDWERLSYATGMAGEVRSMAATGGVRGMYGLSPRAPLPSGNKISKKAKKTF